MAYTYREVSQEGTGMLDFLPDARIDARRLLEHVCGTSIQTLLADPDRPVSRQEYEKYQELIARRQQREPLAYILGEQEFMGLSFRVSPHVLIPGQDTENLVEEAMRELTDGSRILDLCTGSGCILLSLLQYSNHNSGIGTDLSPEALAVAEENGKRLGLSGRAAWLQGDLFEALEGLPEEKFDLIISNPPYIPTEVIGTLEPEVKDREPRMALDGGQDGLDFYRRILTEAWKHLYISGSVMLEIGYDQGDAVRQLMEECGYHDIRIIKDYAGNDRVAAAVRALDQRAPELIQ